MDRSNHSTPFPNEGNGHLEKEKCPSVDSPPLSSSPYSQDSNNTSQIENYSSNQIYQLRYPIYNGMNIKFQKVQYDNNSIQMVNTQSVTLNSTQPMLNQQWNNYCFNQNLPMISNQYSMNPAPLLLYQNNGNAFDNKENMMTQNY